MRHPRNGAHRRVCPLCGGPEAAHRSLESQLRDTSGDTWRLTSKGVRLLSAVRAVEEQALWAEQSGAIMDRLAEVEESKCALCSQRLDPIGPELGHAVGQTLADVLLLCWDCWVETGGQRA